MGTNPLGLGIQLGTDTKAEGSRRRYSYGGQEMLSFKAAKKASAAAETNRHDVFPAGIGFHRR